MEPITERDIKRFELYIFTISILYYLALSLPVIVSLVYFYNVQCRARERKNKYDERVFAASQFLTIGVTLYVCLMPLIL